MSFTFIKILSDNDLDPIKAFFYDIFTEESSYDLKDFKDAISGEHNYTLLNYWLVQDSNSEYIGFCGLEAENTDTCWLGWFGVRPQFRRRGFAKEMLAFLIATAKVLDYKECRVYTDKVINRVAYDFYLSNGFTEDGQYEYDFVTMVKPLVEDHIPIPWVGKPLGFESEPPPCTR